MERIVPILFGLIAGVWLFVVYLSPVMDTFPRSWRSLQTGSLILVSLLALLRPAVARRGRRLHLAVVMVQATLLLIGVVYPLLRFGR